MNPKKIHHEKVKLKKPKETIKRLFQYLIEKQFLLGLVFVLCFVTTGVSIIGTRMNGNIIDRYIIPGDLSGLTRICMILVIMYAVSAGVTFWQNFIMVKIAQTTTAHIRKNLFKTLQMMPVAYFDHHSSGDLMSRLTNDVDNINMMLSQSITQFFSGIITVVGLLLAMLALSPILTIVGLVTIPLVILVSKGIIGYTQPKFIKQQQELGRLNGYIEEMISGQKAVLLFSKEKESIRAFNVINQSFTKNSVIANGVSGFMGPINNFINNLTYLLIAVAGGIMVIKGMGITVGIVFTFTIYMRNFARPINEMLNLFNTIQLALAGAERVFEVMDQMPEEDPKDAKAIEKVKGDVVLKHVNFSYIPGRRILKDASIHARPGETVAIVGPTGAGKTTIINLLTKFYAIESGEILIDNQNINQIKRESLRKNIAMVLQDTFLFSTTIRENIRYGNLTASNEDIEKAAYAAHAHQFIMQLPEGYDTILTDNGSNISQGQRQLLAIARAMLAQSPILILDEATSNIDTRTEVIIQKAMQHLMQGKTTFVIAHRLSTIRNADQILVLRDGQIIEKGVHQELLNQKGFYAELYNSQFKDSIVS